MRDEVINLITKYGAERDEDGFETSSNTHTIEDVFAEIKSVGRTEYYKALREGVKTALVFVIDNDDYELGKILHENVMYTPSKVEYEKIPYKIERTYWNKATNEIELTCTRS